MKAIIIIVPQMQSPSPLYQFGRLALPMQEAAERQQFRSWMLHQLHNTPVETSRNTIGRYMYDMICSKTQHAHKASKISGMILAQYHGDVAESIWLMNMCIRWATLVHSEQSATKLFLRWNVSKVQAQAPRLILPALSAITKILKPNQQFGQGSISLWWLMHWKPCKLCHLPTT